MTAFSMAGGHPSIWRSGQEREGTTAVLELLRVNETPAVVSDMAGRVVLWNAGAEKLLERPASTALGRLCHEVLGGRDIFGNLFCDEDCAVRAMCRKGEAVHPFELVVSSPRPARAFHVSILRLPGTPPDEDLIVHLLQPLDREGRLGRETQLLNPGRGDPASMPPLDSTGAGDFAAALTQRERVVLERIAEGLQNKEIAEKLEISVATVRNHVHNLLDKLGVHSKLEAISMAYRAGWVAVPSRRNGGPPLQQGRLRGLAEREA